MFHFDMQRVSYFRLFHNLFENHILRIQVSVVEVLV
jgi:hypothetical protein